MGRWSYSGKTEADDLQKIGASFLKKHGYFEGRCFGTVTWTHNWSESKSSVWIMVSTINNENYLRIRYTQTDNSSGEKKDFDYKIQLATTPCYLGGKRYWFICPWYVSGVYCGKRVGVLYKGGDYFACRHCYNLTYNSKNQNKYHYHPFFSVLDINQKIEELKEKIKIPYYQGRSTKKQRRLERLYKEAEITYKKAKLILQYEHDHN